MARQCELFAGEGTVSEQIIGPGRKQDLNEDRQTDHLKADIQDKRDRIVRELRQRKQRKENADRRPEVEEHARLPVAGVQKHVSESEAGQQQERDRGADLYGLGPEANRDLHPGYLRARQESEQDEN